MRITMSGSRVLAAAALGLTTAVTAYAGAPEGKALYEQKCQACHSLAGQGGKMAAVGGPVDGVGAKRDADWLRQYLKDPKAAMPGAKMPNLKLTDQQLDDAVAFMLTLKDPPPAK